MKKQALIEFLNLNEEEKEDVIESSYNENVFEYYNEEYEVLTDEEANERWEEELQYYIEEVIYQEIPEIYQPFFDEEAWKNNVMMYEGRGHSISRYNGHENEITIDGETFYIYRQN